MLVHVQGSLHSKNEARTASHTFIGPMHAVSVHAF